MKFDQKRGVRQLLCMTNFVRRCSMSRCPNNHETYAAGSKKESVDSNCNQQSKIAEMAFLSMKVYCFTRFCFFGKNMCRRFLCVICDGPMSLKVLEAGYWGTSYPRKTLVKGSTGRRNCLCRCPMLAHRCRK